MIGKPVYTYGNSVVFYVRDSMKEGEIFIVDAYGTFEQNEEPSYDIFVRDDNCLYKHVRESALTKKG